MITNDLMAPVTVPAKPRRFAAAPFDYVDEFVNYNYHKVKHELRKGKAPIEFLFKDVQQRDAFHSVVAKRLKNIRRRKDSPHQSLESKALLYLSQQSDPESARMNLQGVTDASVEIFGHNNPAAYEMKSGSEFRNGAWLEAMLKQFGISSIGNITLISCSGGAGTRFSGTKEDWDNHFRYDTLASAYRAKVSFAGQLQERLHKKLKYVGTVHGYLTPIYTRPSSPYGDDQFHYYAQPFVHDSEGKKVKADEVRRRYVKVKFPLDESKYSDPYDELS